MTDQTLLTQFNEKIVIGVAETIDLPEIGLSGIVTRIDTGAKTSSLHVDHILADEKAGTIQFEFHPVYHGVESTIHCTTRLHDTRWIKSSNGEKERRYVIRTLARMGQQEWVIELTLADRSSMTHLMLLGREALESKFVVDPEFNFMASIQPD